MPKIQCPYPECTYETEDVSNALAAVLLSVHSAGTHYTHATQVTATQQQTPTTTARVEKVRRIFCHSLARLRRSNQNRR